ncbi:MAG: hypothetical protein M5U28_06815 [Sandaracinaceae bacterium]|nr:hypothetical protein [Sandaracinaceae bacterium]
MRRSDRLIVVSYRGPFRTEAHTKRSVRAAGGLVAALDPVLRARGGVWVSAREAEEPLAEPVADAGYELAHVRLSRRTQCALYEGISNAVLWPLLHGLPPTVRLGTPRGSATARPTRRSRRPRSLRRPRAAASGSTTTT